MFSGVTSNSGQDFLSEPFHAPHLTHAFGLQAIAMTAAPSYATDHVAFCAYRPTPNFCQEHDTKAAVDEFIPHCSATSDATPF